MKTNEDIYTKGFGKISKTFMQDHRIPLAAKGIYSYLCSYSGNSGSAYPSRDKICYDLNINKDTFLKNIKYLIAYG